MNVLYVFGYKTRFRKVIPIIEYYKPVTLLELCFADTVVAEYFKKNNIQWIGFDKSESFVKRARRNGFNANVLDLKIAANFPKSDICLIMGSLYHFHEDISLLLYKMLASSNVIVISEPIKNWTNENNWLGRLAGIFSDAGNGSESFRYDQITINRMLVVESEKLKFNFKVHGFYKKDIVIVIEKTKND